MIGSYSVERGDDWQQIPQINKSGAPVMGFDPTNNAYKLLKVNPDGSLPFVSGGITPLPITDVPYFGNNMQLVPTPGLPGVGAGVYIGLAGAAFISLPAGLYRMNPAYKYEGTPSNGGISFILADAFSAAGAAISTTPPGNILNFNTGALGVYAYWHNSTAQTLDVNSQIAYNRNNVQEIYLPAGFYFMAFVTEGIINFSSVRSYFGWYEFTKLA